MINYENPIEKIASICHDANRGICHANGDYVQPLFQDLKESQREGLIKGVEFTLTNPDATPEDQHNAWCKSKLEQGYIYGIFVDHDKKTHNCLKSYDQLPANQRIKDVVFQSIVKFYQKEWKL